MGVARNILLWGSRSERLRSMLPRYRFVRRSVTRFMPGEEPPDALNAAQTLKENGIPTVITHLGENLHTADETWKVRDHYLDVLDQIQARGLDTHISVKLTELGLDQNPELCYSNMAALVKKAEELKNYVWIDIEGSPYTTATLQLFHRVR
ncbi:MAG TPA: proline dehydrogenase family protein, partial [Acidobacteriota bacterium]|nr:proline dehydrogenase family protein [Acidobacteriota bacterium]